MRIDPNDLRCPACAAAIHPFAAACPACGAACESLLSEARRDPDIGAAALAESEAVIGDVRMVANFYRFRSGGAPDGITLRQGIGIAFDVVQYRIEGEGAPLDPAWVSLDGDSLAIRDHRSGDRSARHLQVPAWSLLGAAAGEGRITLYRAAGATPLVIRNRGGLLATKPRPDHYRALERWFAVLIAEAAERRWQAIGVDGHAAELALAGADPAVAPPASTAPASNAPAGNAGASAAPPTGTAMATAGAPGTSIADALRSLDGLRDANLVSDAEYQVKRREILDRL